MGRRRAPQTPPPEPVALGDAVTTEHLKSAVEAGIGPLKTELRWQRWVLFGLAALTLGPHFPAAPAIAVLSATPDVAHVIALARASL